MKYWYINCLKDNGSIVCAGGSDYICAETDEEALRILKKKQHISLLYSIEEVSLEKYEAVMKRREDYARWCRILDEK